MGIFKRRSEIEEVLLVHGGRLWQKMKDDDSGEHRWLPTSKAWVSLFATTDGASDVQMISRLWPGTLKGSRRIEIAFNELAAYYIFRTLQIGDGEFVRYNHIDQESFVREVSEIMDLSSNQLSRIDYYIQNYGTSAVKKFYAVPQFTAKLAGEFQALRVKETEDLLGAIAIGIKDFHDVPIPDKRAMKEIQQRRQLSGIAFNQMLERDGLLPKSS